MKTSAVISTLVFLLAAPVLAQEAPNSHTLDEQLQRVKSGQPAVPLSASSKTGKTHVKKTASVPATEPVPAPVVSAEPKVPPIAYDKYGQPIDSIGGGAIPALPLQEMISGEIHFITGGVGDEEMDQLKAVENDYNFRLTITAGGGEFLSGCTLRLRDDKGVDVLATDGAGPLFFAKLKPGTYSLSITTSQGAEQTVPVKVMPNVTLKKTVQFNV